MALAQYFGEIFIAVLRKNISLHLHAMILKNKKLYQLIFAEKNVDNYDQRISDDLETFLQCGVGTIMGSLSRNPSLTYEIWLGIFGFKSALQGMLETSSHQITGCERCVLGCC